MSKSTPLETFFNSLLELLMPEMTGFRSAAGDPLTLMAERLSNALAREKRHFFPS
jgi:hypothetical protein